MTDHDEEMGIAERSWYVRAYLREATAVLAEVDPGDVVALVDLIYGTREAGGRVFVVGNGGGAAHASHFAADLRRLAGCEAYAATDNPAEITAIANDMCWNVTYAEWLTSCRIGSRDTLFVFSVGGGSREVNLSMNIVHAIDHALGIGARVGGIVGPEGGVAYCRSHAVVRIPVSGVVGTTWHTEGLQAVIAHLIISHPRLLVGAPTWEQRKEGSKA